MTVTELMTGKTPNPSYEGFSTADDYVLAVNLADTPATSPNGYYVAQLGITEHSGAMEAVTVEKQYMRAGQMLTKTGTKRTFAITGDRYFGDEFQDAILAHSLKYGTGQATVREFVYFNLLTGKGEKGKVSITVEADPGGVPGENANFGATLTAVGTPEEYEYKV